VGQLNNAVSQNSVQEIGNLLLSVTGGAVLYVGTASQLSAMTSQTAGGIAGRTFSTINAALAQCVAGRGDVIFVLPGYTETIATADAWSTFGAGLSDVTIVGMGHGTNRPTLTWSTATSTVIVDSNNVTISNMILQLEPTTGSVNVAAPISVSGNGCQITNCRINCGTDANNKVTIGVTVTGNDFVFTGNQVRGAALATCTTFLRLTGCANPVIQGNDIVCGTTSAAVGPIQELTTACTGILIDNNFVQNNAASSTACITMALANTTGWISSNKCRNMTDASNAQIVVTSGDVQLFDNKGVNNSNETAILLGTASV